MQIQLDIGFDLKKKVEGKSTTSRKQQDLEAFLLNALTFNDEQVDAVYEAREVSTNGGKIELHCF